MAGRDELIDRLDSIFSRIGRLARRKMPDDTLTFGQFAVLQLLFQRGRLAMGTIAEHLGISLAGATGIIDRLVHAGVVERTRSQEDRRVVWVQLSAQGLERMQRMQQERHHSMLSLLEPLSEEQLETLVNLLETIARGQERQMNTEDSR
ncbi:regulatory protein MarR [Sulfobacillus acidophilus DSM 10332]|uniref:Regulatory protein MarR n=1 Tax=Sulfobacillus acidophilus (strain ATCC 700253 / DSM 10332 / NAL) TaxID=679936 RepID=G8TXI9_SULAD|nr:regulatory protein MarR [Sulfobacillus acidophilus DSM 10332]MCY0863750.1 MarR family transcriptional regulator [Sulfobacillus sp.]